MMLPCAWQLHFILQAWLPRCHWDTYSCQQYIKKDFATALGPWITTRDELDLTNLMMVARVNGAEWSRGSSKSITWSIEELIAYPRDAQRVLPQQQSGLRAFFIASLSRKREDV